MSRFARFEARTDWRRARKTAFLQPLCQLDLLRNVVRCLRIEFRGKAIHRRTIVEPHLCVVFGNLIDAPPRRFRGRLHLVLAVVGIGDQMPDVRDIDDERDLEALTLQKALQ